MIIFEYNIELCEGSEYRPVMSNKLENEVIITIQAPNRVTADRMIRSIINPDAIANIIGVALN